MAGWLIFERGGNRADGGACDAARAYAELLQPLVRGEIAAFQVTDTPRKLPELSFTRWDGKHITLSQFQGSVVLLNVWATWCAPCRKEMPAFDRLEAELGDQDFAVVAVSIDTTDPNRPTEFLRSVQAGHLKLYVDPTTEVFQTLKTESLARGLPVSVLFDRNGCYVGHMNGPAEWDSPDGKGLINALVSSS